MTGQATVKSKAHFKKWIVFLMYLFQGILMYRNLHSWFCPKYHLPTIWKSRTRSAPKNDILNVEWNTIVFCYTVRVPHTPFIHTCLARCSPLQDDFCLILVPTSLELAGWFWIAVPRKCLGMPLTRTKTERSPILMDMDFCVCVCNFITALKCNLSLYLLKEYLIK